jgi:hypothetical protein
MNTLSDLTAAVQDRLSDDLTDTLVVWAHRNGVSLEQLPDLMESSLCYLLGVLTAGN